MLAILALSLGLAGLYQPEQTIERIGSGANLVLLLDRSRSMDDSFAGRNPSGTEASKSTVAEQLLKRFLDGRPHDRVGVAAFSTSPLYVLPLTEQRDAVLAAVRASSRPALAQTHVGKGLAMALSYFDGANTPESGLILLVSDGAALIDPSTEALLRQAFVKKNLRLYWIYLRSQGSPGLFETPVNPDEDNAQSRPERYLHLFFNSLKVPYQAYEAENPDAVRHAMEEINRLENKPFAYTERIPRRDLQGTCFGLAALAIGLLCFAKWHEVRA
jgi:mxaC protein